MNPSNADSVLSMIGEKIKQRSENLALSAVQRRAEKEISTSSTENVDFFTDNFMKMKEDLENKIANAGTVDKMNLLNFLDQLVEDVSMMQKLLNESSMFLASFQIKRAQESINSINESVQQVIKELQPKKKFGFKNKNEDKFNPQRVKCDKLVDKTDGMKLHNSDISDHIKKQPFFGFKDRVNETLQISAEELKNRQLNLRNLTNCKIIALGNPSSLQFANLKDTTVLVGPTSRSAFIKECINCHFVLACQQVRIHNTEDTKFYLHVTGAAIIENCKRVSFGPYTIQYPELSNHFYQSGLSTEFNYWNKVEDFHWLNEKEKSPNFILLDEKNWQKDWLE